MENRKISKTEKSLRLDFQDKQSIWLTNQNTLRKLVGILGMSLPILLTVFLYVATGHSTTLQSISHYYFTRVGGIFIIILSLLAIFLLVYKGHEPIDFYISSIAGIFALCVVLFPTTNLGQTCCDEKCNYAVTFLSGKTEWRANFHYISASIFLSCLAFMALFLFTKSNKLKTNRKKTRNVIYITCGVIMLASLLIILLGYFGILIPTDYYIKNNLTFWMESIAVESFGISWLVKGEAILKDNTAL